MYIYKYIGSIKDDYEVYQTTDRRIPRHKEQGES